MPSCLYADIQKHKQLSQRQASTEPMQFNLFHSLHLFIYLTASLEDRHISGIRKLGKRSPSKHIHSRQMDSICPFICPHLKEQVEAVKLLQLYVCLIYKKKQTKKTANSIHRWGLIWCWQIWQVVSLNAGKWEVFNPLSTDQEGDEISHYVCLHSKPALIFSTLKCCSRFYTSSGKNANNDFSLAIRA